MGEFAQDQGRMNGIALTTLRQRFTVFDRYLLVSTGGGSRASRWVDASSTIATCLVLVALLGQFSFPFVANTLCGLIIPHQHILVGRANELDLERHLTAEARCAARRPDMPDAQAAELHGSKGQILNVVNLDGSQITYLAILSNTIADLPTGIVVAPFRPLYSLLEIVHLPGPAVAILPPTPPPKTV